MVEAREVSSSSPLWPFTQFYLEKAMVRFLLFFSDSFCNYNKIWGTGCRIEGKEVNVNVLRNFKRPQLPIRQHLHSHQYAGE